MAKSQQSYNKKEKEKKRLKKRLDKQKKKEERKNSEEGGTTDMVAYVDEFGNITDTPPDLSQKEEIDVESIEIGVPKKGDVVFDPVRTGIVDFFNDQKGFGFIKDLETQDSYFVHVNGCTEEIREGNKVSFELEKGMKGLNAVRVKIVK